MNTLGMSILLKMGGCLCTNETIEVNGIRYVVKERLGEGGFSQVDLIQNKVSKRKFALKRILCHSIEDQKIAMDEIGFCKRIQHPNIIELIDSTFKGSADIVVNATSEAFLILPYFRLGTLHDHLSMKAIDKVHLPIDTIVRYFHDICQAVKYLHHFKPEPIAHRDLKTANVCLNDNFEPILMDLGSCTNATVHICGAQDAQKLQDLAAERCSMTYRAPELFHVESYCVIDQRTDIWSLGCLLYALCYYKSPFDAVYERGDSVNLAVISGNVAYPQVTLYPEEVHDLIGFMLAVNPAKRPFIVDVLERLDQLRFKIEAIL